MWLAVAFPDPLYLGGFPLSIIVQTLLAKRNEHSMVGGREDATSIKAAVATVGYGVAVVVPAAHGLVCSPVR